MTDERYDLLLKESRKVNRAWQKERDRRVRAEEALHQWLGAYAAGYFDNIALTRRLTVKEIVKNSNEALAAVGVNTP